MYASEYIFYSYYCHIPRKGLSNIMKIKELFHSFINAMKKRAMRKSSLLSLVLLIIWIEEPQSYTKSVFILSLSFVQT